MQTQKRDTFAGPWVLPMVQCGPTRYIVNLRLRQFRDIDAPYECVEFDSEQGRQMRGQCGIVVCPACGMSAIVSAASNSQELRCMLCFSRVAASDEERSRNPEED